MTELRRKRFDDWRAFFSANGSGWMKLSASAASETIERLISQGHAVTNVEAGIWHDPGFEARLDGITNIAKDEKNGLSQDELAEYFSRLPSSYDTFIITVGRGRRNNGQAGSQK